MFDMYGKDLEFHKKFLEKDEDLQNIVGVYLKIRVVFVVHLQKRRMAE
jgi:hypothetical protein